LVPKALWPNARLIYPGFWLKSKNFLRDRIHFLSNWPWFSKSTEKHEGRASRTTHQTDAVALRPTNRGGSAAQFSFDTGS
jgi:hypothetical protein